MDFYDRSGRATAYLADDEHIYDWDGTPSAFIRNGNVYSYSGEHVGWLVNGWITGADGQPLLFSQEAMGGPVKPVRQVAPVRGVRSVRPVKGVAQVAPVRPVFGLGWSSNRWGSWL
ncbi:4-fold beta flower protein [Bradyrhizobium archetypum]|uniref:4-fold beta flower protein n=1 Tax=Bradyrhizobium archetypum TaxID=2721160 RepID=UPI0035E003BE